MTDCRHAGGPARRVLVEGLATALYIYLDGCGLARRSSALIAADADWICARYTHRPSVSQLVVELGIIALVDGLRTSIPPSLIVVKNCHGRQFEWRPARACVYPETTTTTTIFVNSRSCWPRQRVPGLRDHGPGKIGRTASTSVTSDLTRWRFWGFHFGGHWGGDTFIWGAHN